MQMIYLQCVSLPKTLTASRKESKASNVDPLVIGFTRTM